jgi:hypothetical protein
MNEWINEWIEIIYATLAVYMADRWIIATVGGSPQFRILNIQPTGQFRPSQ